MPSITLGTSSFAIELWARKKFGNSPGNDEQFWTGLLLEDPAGGLAFPFQGAAIRWGTLDTMALQLWFARVPGTATITLVTTCLMSELTGWTHIVMEGTRAGVMELFRNNVSEGSVSIAAQSASQAATEVHVLTSDHVFAAHAPELSELSNYAVFPVVVGPFAIHARIMTAAERQDSISNRTVQNFGSATTFIRYEWKEFQGHSGWDSGQERLQNGHKFGLASPGAIPLGVSGAVTARDSSGNNRHWTLPTLATEAAYAARIAPVYAAENGTWPLAFGADPEFR
jgi:hypothetical protein